MSKSNTKKVVFFTPHADDIEFGCPFMCLKSLKLGYDVTEVLMTNCQYGTERKEFRGERLEKIRKREMENVVKIYNKYTKNQLKIIYAGFIDGHLPLNQKALNYVINLIKEIKPDIVFAPDPVYAIDYHFDHLNTGRLVYFSLKRLKSDVIPKRVFFYYSFKSNISLRCRFKDLKIVIEALSQHKSQVSPLRSKFLLFSRKIFQIYKCFKYRGFSERFRELKMVDGKPKTDQKINTIKDNMLYSLYYKLINYPYDWYFPTPEELGLQEKVK
jgi:hypothetical protein